MNQQIRQEIAQHVEAIHNVLYAMQTDMLYERFSRCVLHTMDITEDIRKMKAHVETNKSLHQKLEEMCGHIQICLNKLDSANNGRPNQDELYRRVAIHTHSLLCHISVLMAWNNMYGYYDVEMVKHVASGQTK